MPRTYDDRRWIQNPDGSFSRRIQAPVEEPAAVVVPESQIIGDNYFKDITTTGAAADLAAELGIDLSEVDGTGLHGKITKADVQKAAAGN